MPGVRVANIGWQTRRRYEQRAHEWLAAHAPADLEIFEHSGHCPMWEEPELWNRTVGDWIAALPA